MSSSALARAQRAAAVGLLGLQAAAGQPASRLRVRNGCADAPVWIAHEVASGMGPNPQNLEIPPMQFHDFLTPDGMAATRFWPKMGCDAQGGHCALGGSGGPGEACVIRGPSGDNYDQCAPPIDTKFEASFGNAGIPCTADDQSGCDFIDISLVDGFTLPFKLEMTGPWCSRSESVIDCSGLTFDKCPAAENMHHANVIEDLKAVNPTTGKAAGCYSPCSKLTMGKWSNKAMGSRMDPRISPYCCPTPPVTPEACRAGPVERTAFVTSVHQFCPGVYAYSFDDAMGLAKCDPRTRYELTFFCPSVPQSQVPAARPDAPAPKPAAEAAIAARRPDPVPEPTPPEAEQAAAPQVPPTLAPPEPPVAPTKVAEQIQTAAALSCASTVGDLCDVFVPGRGCQCDAQCQQRESCCEDHAEVCGGARKKRDLADYILFSQHFSLSSQGWGVLAIGAALTALTSLSALALLLRVRKSGFTYETVAPLTDPEQQAQAREAVEMSQKYLRQRHASAEGAAAVRGLGCGCIRPCLRRAR